MTASKQLLINFTSTSGSLNFDMIIVDYFLVHPKFIQSRFKHVSRFCMHNTIRQTVKLAVTGDQYHVTGSALSRCLSAASGNITLHPVLYILRSQKCFETELKRCWTGVFWY